MARVAMRGYELQDFGATLPNFAEGNFVQDARQGTFAAATGRTGGTALAITTGWDVLYLGNVPNFTRAYFKLAAGTAGTIGIASNMSAAASGLTGGQLCLVWDPANQFWVLKGHGAAGAVSSHNFSPTTNVGATLVPGLYAPSAGEWIMVELGLNYGGVNLATDVYFRINGGVTVRQTNQQFSVAPNRVTLGMDLTAAAGGLGTAVAGSQTVDDVVIDDEVFPGEGCVRWLLPVSDSARGANWVAGAGGTTNLWDAINNAPPVGLAAATNTSQIKNAAKDTTGLYDALMQSYDAAGVPGDHDITALFSEMIHGPSAASAIGAGLTVVSNPAVAETTDAGAATAVGTYPTGWRLIRQGMQLGPVLTRGVGPVMRARKNTSSTTSLYVALMAICVDAAQRRPCGPRTMTQARQQASLW